MTVIERLLDGLDVEVEALVVHDTRRALPLDCRQADAAIVRVTRSGSALVELAGGATVRFSRQGVIVLPARWRTEVLPAGRAPRGTAPDPDILTACGRIHATYRGSIALFDHLQEPLVQALAADDAIARSFEELTAEIAAQQPGYRALVETLLRRGLILLLRRSFEHIGCRTSWLAALEDPRLGRAVAAMQEQLERSLTLAALADIAGMSRSVFAARFTEAVGHPPMEFLKTLRLARAAHLLVRTDRPVKSVAARVGYASRSSFTRAFLAHHGVGPTAFRAAAREPGAGRPAAAA